MHELGKPGWFSLIPFYNIMLLVTPPWTVGDACPTENLSGTCIMPLDDAPAGFNGTVPDHYYAPTLTAQAEGYCKGAKGSFTAKP